jgi:hypothetical protein
MNPIGLLQIKIYAVTFLCIYAAASAFSILFFNWSAVNTLFYPSHVKLYVALFQIWCYLLVVIFALDTYSMVYLSGVVLAAKKGQTDEGTSQEDHGDVKDIPI